MGWFDPVYGLDSSCEYCIETPGFISHGVRVIINVSSIRNVRTNVWYGVVILKDRLWKSRMSNGQLGSGMKKRENIWIVNDKLIGTCKKSATGGRNVEQRRIMANKTMIEIPYYM